MVNSEQRGRWFGFVSHGSNEAVDAGFHTCAVWLGLNPKSLWCEYKSANSGVEITAAPRPQRRGGLGLLPNEPWCSSVDVLKVIAPRLKPVLKKKNSLFFLRATGFCSHGQNGKYCSG